MNLPRILYNRGYNALGVLVATACQFARLSGWRKDIFLTPGPVAFTPWKSSLFYVKNIVGVHMVLFYKSAQMFILVCCSYALQCLCVLCVVKANEEKSCVVNKNKKKKLTDFHNWFALLTMLA